MCKIAKSSSRETISSLSRSYILKATEILIVHNDNSKYQTNTEIITFELFFAAVQLVVFVRFDWSEVGENLHELQEVHPVVMAAGEEGMDDSVAERIDGQFGYSQKVFPRQSAAVASVQRRETRI